MRAELVRKLALAAGARGMAGGQMIDLLGVRDDLGAVARMQRLKTGALIAFAFEMPADRLRARPRPTQRARWPSPTTWAWPTRSSTTCWTPTASSDLLGKAANGKDAASGKANFVTLLGVDAAREQVALLADQARGRSTLWRPSGIF